ncbi:hypothetical protein SUGI_0521710 [Cryptomeria japonica]|uniref:uncharacterized protein LOC131063517 isoform X2 n=1 Tax=Cryptomeria japonica TaxID=3369 RepID=UPI002408BF05|nr:uncharacterized protein LOC131063517 isoform X2 [Cryptomeria japonica]GLJ26764.1 hypothetical protein SUGI_0521710 [Cryptomeria japonica]
MTGIITRSHRVNHAKWKHLPKERSCCNVVRHLISATNLHKKSAKSCTGGVYNEKETKFLGSKKKGFHQELDKKKVPKAKHVQTSVSLENEDSRERPAVSVYSRITRAKSKFISGTEMANNDIGGDVACKDAENTLERKKSNMGLKVHKMRTGENIPQADAEFVEQTQDRMIEGRMTRSKKNMLLLIQADKEIEGAGDLNHHTNEEICIGKYDKNPVLTYDHTLQRKRKRMSAMMYGEELEYSYCFTGKDLASEPQTKKDLPVRVTTRSAIHKQNASTTINNQIIRKDKELNGELKGECKEAEVAQQDQLEFAARLESQEKSKSFKWKDLKENVSSPEALRKPSEQKDEILLGTKDSHLSRNLRNTRSTVGKEIVNPVQISDLSPQKNHGEKVVVHATEGSRRGKAIAMASIPKRMTRSMQKDLLDLELVQINEKRLITCKRKRLEGGHSPIPRKSIRIKKQPISFTMECTEETQSVDEQCIKSDNSLKMKSEEPDLNGCGKLEDKDQCNNSNPASGKLNLSKSVKGIVDLKGKRPLYMISNRREKPKFDVRRKEYLTRSKDKEEHSSLKVEGLISPCYKNALHSSIERPGDDNVSSPTDEPTVMPPTESDTLETSVRQFPMDTDIEVHLCLKSEGEAKSFLQDTSHLEQPVKTLVGNQPPYLCYEQTYNDSIPEIPGYQNVFCNGSRKLNLYETIKGREDLAGNEHLYRKAKRKEKKKYDIRRKEYLTRSKHVERNIQEDEDKHSSFKAEPSTTPCDTNELNSNTKDPREVDVPITTNELVVLPPVESAKVDTSVGKYSMDKDSADHLKLKWEGQTKPSQQNTPGLKLLEKYYVDNQQICNKTIPETMGCSNAVGEFQLGTPLVVSNIDQVDAKSGDLAGSSDGPLKVTACHVESSHCFDGNSCPVLKKETCEITFISGINFDPVRKSDESGVDEHDCVPHDEFGDVKKKCFKIVNNPNDLGGRQMRPRPLDPLQPLPVFIEGRDQEFHDLNSAPFQWHSRHHGEEKFSIVASSRSEHTSSSLKLKKQEIKIPSYRNVAGYHEVRRSLNGGKSVCTIPGPYIRHFVSDKNQITGSEYDLEEDDEEWLRSFNEGNAERKISFQLTEDKFEELMEYFEKESAKVSAHWGVNDPVVDSLRHSTDKRNPISDAGKEELVHLGGKDSSTLSNVSQTSDCCICNGGEDSISNSVNRCKSCGIYVHHSCYGVNGQQNTGQADRLKISDWLCRKCEVLGGANVHICCAICGKNGGALKPTTNPGKWAHVVCALYTNETFFLDSDSMEPIDGVSTVEVRSRRQKRLCYLCGARVGSCERCSVYGCGAVFHISCGVNQGAYFEMQHNNQEVVNVRSFCPGHANDAHRGFVEEGSNVKDTCETPIKDDASVPKKQRRRMLRHRIKSAVRLNRCKTVSRNKMLFVDDSLHTDKSSISSFLNLTGTSEQQQVPRLSDKMQNKDANIGPTEGSVLSKLNTNGIERNKFIELKEVLKANVAPASHVRGVYSYWLRKRVQKKGPLLQRLQQEETAKIHGIFNQDSAGIREYFGLKEDLLDKLVGCSSTDFKMVLKKLRGLQRGLKSVRSMAKVVIEREKLKAHLVSDFPLLAQTKLFALQRELGFMSCFLCKSSESLLLCAQCKRIFCFQCYKHWKVQGVKSFRILSCKKCFCMDCEAVYKADSVNSPSEKFSMKSPQTDVSQRITEVPKSSDYSSDATVKRTMGCEVEDAPKSITNGVCSVSKTEVAEDTDSKADASVNPNKQVFDNTCNFCPLTADAASFKVIDGHPMDAKGRQQSPCKTVLLSDFTDAVNLNNSSLGKSPSNYCDKNVQKTCSKRRKPDT